MPDPAQSASPAVTLPAGARDVLPAEAAQLRAIERTLVSSIARYGYREVILPVLELADVMDRAQEGGIERAFRLFDDHGRVLVLRPDLTIPVARLIASRLGDVPGPIRLWYSARRFRRPAAGRAEPIEEWQVGVELAGDPSPEADAEILALLGRCLQATGLADARIAVGDLAITAAVMDDLGVDPSARRALHAAAAERNLVAWRERVATAGLRPAGASLLAALPELRGGADVLDQVVAGAPGAASACRRLRRTLDLIPGHGVLEAPLVDLGVFRDWPYYTGLLIEAHAPGVGAPVAAGGRYDALGDRFGAGRPSSGFSIDLDVLHRALRAGGVGGAGERVGVVVVDGGGGLLSQATAARAGGLRVIAAPDLAGARALAERDRCRYLARADGDGILVEDLAGGPERRVVQLADLAPEDRS